MLLEDDDSCIRASIYHYTIDLRGSAFHEQTDVGEISDIRNGKGSFGSAVVTY